jgi:RNA-splicing ligase RtcB
MLATASRVLNTEDARDYLAIMTEFMHKVKNAGELADIVIAAGIADEELQEFRRRLEDPARPGLYAVEPELGKEWASQQSAS